MASVFEGLRNILSELERQSELIDALPVEDKLKDPLRKNVERVAEHCTEMSNILGRIMV